MDTLAENAKNRLAGSRRLIVKIGSALMVDEVAGEIRANWLKGLTSDIAALRAKGKEVAIVSSGAIAVGRTHLGLTTGELALEQKQAAAATGQIRLAHAWQEALGAHGMTVAQILLTLSDTEERRRHLNARATIETLLQMGAVPVINENDTVATEEIRYGDNDRLAARVAQMISADTLILLSDVDGLYDADPRTTASPSLIREVTEITPEIEAMAGSAPAGFSSGGMVTKLDAAKIATAAGCAMAITDGNTTGVLATLAAGGSCTWFLPASEPLTARKRWIAGAVVSSGAILVDIGAAKALQSGNSLLPAGVTGVEGRFQRGDAVEIRLPSGTSVGRGLSAYSSEDAARIAGRKSRDIEDILGYRGRDVMIHRDDMVLETIASEAREE